MLVTAVSEAVERYDPAREAVILLETDGITLAGSTSCRRFRPQRAQGSAAACGLERVQWLSERTRREATQPLSGRGEDVTATRGLGGPILMADESWPRDPDVPLDYCSSARRVAIYTC